MKGFSLDEYFEPITWRCRLRALLEVLLLSGIFSGFLADFSLSFIWNGDTESLLKDTGMLSFSLILEAGFTFLLLIFLLRIRGEKVRSIGLHGNRWKSNLGLGLGTVPFLFAVNFAVAWFFQTFLPRYYLEGNPLTENIRTVQELGLFIIAAIIAGGIREELQRAFILNRFERYLGGAGPGLALWSVAFGLGHYIQGPQAIVAAGIFSIIFGLLYLGRKSLIAPIAAHSVYNTLALIGYWYASHSA
jgi:membrane protease YdiL (CAAX protease family)